MTHYIELLFSIDEAELKQRVSVVAR